MTNFIQDNSALPDEKTAYQLRPSIPVTKKLRAEDWNAIRTALLDTQTYLRGAEGNGYISARNEGVKGDGSTDDTVAAQAAIAKANTLKCALFFPEGEYVYSRASGQNHSLVLQDLVGVELRGVKGRTKFRHANNAATGVESCQMVRVSNCERVKICGITFDGNWGNGYTYVTYGSDLEDLSASNFTLDVDDTSDFPSSGSFVIVAYTGPQTITYTGKTLTTFTGCNGGTGRAQKYDKIGLIDKQQKTDTIAAGSNGLDLPQSTINVEDTDGFPTSASAGLFRVLTSNGYQSVTYTGKTGTSFTGCLGGTGTMTTGNAVQYVDGAGNQLTPMQVDPKNHALFIYGTDGNFETPNRNITVEDCYFQDVYGDFAWIGAYSYNIDLVRCVGITSGRNGVTISSFADNVSMRGCYFDNVFTSACDSEPVDAPTRRVTIDDCDFGIWFNPWHSIANIAMSIQGGTVGRPAEWNFTSRWRVTNSRFAGTILVSDARGVNLIGNEITLDFESTTFGPIVVEMFCDDIFGEANHVWSRAASSDLTGKGLINITRYQTGVHTAAQPGNIVMQGNFLHPRNDLCGIYVEAIGGYSGYEDVATGYTAPSAPTNLGEISVAGTPWSGINNYFVGHQVLKDGKLANIVGNDDNTLFIAPLYENYTAGLAWHDANGRTVTNPATTGAFTILPTGGRVVLDHNIIDPRDIDGAGPGSNGIWIATNTTWDAGFNHMRLSVCRNNIRGATGPAILIATQTGSVSWKELELVGNHAWDDQPTTTCTATIEFVNPDGIDQKTIHGNTKGDTVPDLIVGLASGIWQSSCDFPGEWAGFEDPNGLIAAPPSATFRHLGANAIYVKQSPADADTGWVVLKSALRANVRSIGTLKTGTGALDMSGFMPASVDGDIELLFVNTNNGGSDPGAVTLSTPSRFIKKIDDDSNYSSSSIVNRAAIFWRRKRSTDVAPVVADGGSDNEAIVVAFKDCVAYGDPFEFAASTSNNGLNLDVTTPGGTTASDGALYFEFVTWFNGGTLGNIDDWTNADSDLTETAEVFDDSRAVGTEKIGLAIWGGRTDDAAAVAGTDANISAGSYAVWTAISFGLTPGAEPARSIGTITCVAKASLVDTDYITIPDGISVPKVYEFDTAGDGVTAGRVQVNVSTDTSATDVAARLRTAILAAQPSLSVTDNADGTLTVRHNWAGAGGNVAMTENVGNGGFAVSGLSGGAG